MALQYNQWEAGLAWRKKAGLALRSWSFISSGPLKQPSRYFIILLPYIRSLTVLDNYMIHLHFPPQICDVSFPILNLSCLSCWENWSFQKTCASCHQLTHLWTCICACIHYFFCCTDKLSVLLDSAVPDMWVPDSIPSPHFSVLWPHHQFFFSTRYFPQACRHSHFSPYTKQKTNKILCF